jgi:hypothetical protein
MYGTLAILATFIFFYSIASKGLERTPVKGAILSVMLAPTDAALGKVVVSDESVPGLRFRLLAWGQPFLAAIYQGRRSRFLSFRRLWCLPVVVPGSWQFMGGHW